MLGALNFSRLTISSSCSSYMLMAFSQDVHQIEYDCISPSRALDDKSGKSLLHCSPFVGEGGPKYNSYNYNGVSETNRRENIQRTLYGRTSVRVPVLG